MDLFSRKIVGWSARPVIQQTITAAEGVMEQRAVLRAKVDRLRREFDQTSRSRTCALCKIPATVRQVALIAGVLGK